MVTFDASTVLCEGDVVIFSPAGIAAEAPGDYPNGFAKLGDAAEFLRVGETTVRKLIDGGELQAVRIPGVRSIRIPWESLNNFASRMLGEDNG